MRVGILMAAVAALYGIAELVAYSNVSSHALERFGRSSLFVYWIHVELVYGYASWFWWHRLPLWGTVLAYAAFCALIYGAVVLRDHVVNSWRARRLGPATEPATA